MKAVKLIVEGKVQGVGFRNFIETKAAKLNLIGYVKNSNSGHVEIWAEGNEPELLHLVETAKKGSLFSKVTHVEVSWLEPSNKFNGFIITY